MRAVLALGRSLMVFAATDVTAAAVPERYESEPWSAVLTASTPISVTLEGRDVAVDSPAALTFFEQRAPPDLLRDSAAAFARAGNADKGRRLLEGTVQLSPFPAVPLPADLAWSENPLRDRNWQWRLHQLIYFADAMAAYEADGDPRVLDLLVRHLEDWLRDNVTATPPAEMSWHDHATALRLRTALYTYAFFHKHHRARKVLPLILRFVHVHAEVLAHRTHYSRHTNHGLDQSWILCLAAATFPELSSSVYWRSLGRARVDDEIGFAFTEEGVHVENSPGYHVGQLASVIAISQNLATLFGGSPAPRLQAVLDKAVRVSTHLVRPDGTLPLLGDTARELVRADARLAGAPGFPELQYVTSGGRLGTRPRERDLVLAKSGYAILRDRPYEPSAAQDGVHLVFKSGFHSGYHRHDDDLAVSLWALGSEWLIDGGLYVHDHQDPMRAFLRSARAHTTWDIQGVEPVRGGERLARDSGIRASQTMGDTTWVRAVSAMYPGFVITRSVQYERPHHVTLVDRVEPTSSGHVRQYRAFLQLPAEHQVHIHGHAVEVTARTGARLSISVVSDALRSLTAVSAQREPEILGWRSQVYGALEPAVSIVASFEGTTVEAVFDMRLHPAP